MVNEKLKKMLIEERKAKGPNVAFLSFVKSEIENIGKNDGNRLTTNDEAVKKVRNLKKVSEEVGNDKEVELLNSLLPNLITEEEFRAGIEAGDVPFGETLGETMKIWKGQFGSLLDMKMAKAVFDSYEGKNT